MGGEQVSELTISGTTATWAHSDMFAGDKLLATYNSTGIYFSLNDWLGTKRAEVGTSPYGVPIIGLTSMRPVSEVEISQAAADGLETHRITSHDRQVANTRRTEAISMKKQATPQSNGKDQVVGNGGEFHQVANGAHPPMTNQTGTIVFDDENSLKTGDRGPSLLEDHFLLEKTQHFDHERIPERIVHARGFGAHGFFELTNSLSKVSKAGVLMRHSGRFESSSDSTAMRSNEACSRDNGI